MAAATLQLPTWTEAVLSAAREAATNASLVIEDVSGALTSSPEGEVYEIVVVTPSTTDTRHMLDAEQAIRESVFQQFPQDISIRVTRLT